MKKVLLLSVLSAVLFPLCAAGKTLKAEKQYLNLPVSHGTDRAEMEVTIKGETVRNFKVRLAPEEPQYWVFLDISEFKGKTLEIEYKGRQEGLGKICQSDEPVGYGTFYEEKYRPAFHFTSQRGWINDPNGLIYYDGEYHLFFQHNPYERDWENMHWGHAVSKDLVHWKQLPEALYPDRLGTMFSGSAVIDYNNDSGFGKKGKPAMVAYYTAAAPDRQTQCIAYSLDRGRTWAKYTGNPVVDSKEKWNSEDTRDPKVFYYEPGGHWVMVLNERDGHSIYTSANMRDWTYESHITGFWECPELFELPVDGDKDNTKWVMYGASGTYMLGDFDGKVFTPESGKHLYTAGTIYAAQTYSNIPAEDGRRIQVGWSRMNFPGETAFNGMMLMPTELTLRTTKDGPRIYNVPVRETERLFTSVGKWEGLDMGRANEVLKQFAQDDVLRVRTTFRFSHATWGGLDYNGQRIADYDMNMTKLSGTFYSPQDMTSMELTVDVYADKALFEVFVDGGAYSYSLERNFNMKSGGWSFWGYGGIEVRSLEVFRVKSIWGE